MEGDCAWCGQGHACCANHGPPECRRARHVGFGLARCMPVENAPLVKLEPRTTRMHPNAPECARMLGANWPMCHFYRMPHGMLLDKPRSVLFAGQEPGDTMLPPCFLCQDAQLGQPSSLEWKSISLTPHNQAILLLLLLADPGLQILWLQEKIWE